MKKLIHFRADQRFLDYIKMIGYKHAHVSGTRSLYFTNNLKGCQIVVNLQARNIRFLDAEGWSVGNTQVSVTSEDLETYATYYSSQNSES
jgi:hypothetical protein